MNKMIPLTLIVVGGVMIYAGINGDNPLTVLKGVLTNSYVPAKPPAAKPTTPTGAINQFGSNLGQVILK